MRKCKTCGKNLLQKGQTLYCDEKCKYKQFLIRNRPQPKIKQFKCKICGKKFKDKNKNRKYCSAKCLNISRSKNRLKPRGKWAPKISNAAYKKPLYDGTQYSSNEDKAIEILKKNGFNKSIIGEVLGRKPRSIKNREQILNLDNFVFNKAKNVKFANLKKEVKILNSTKKTEAITNHVVYNNLIKQGFEIFRVTREGAEFDLIAYKNSKFFKIQIKTAGYNEKWDLFRLGSLTFFHADYSKGKYSRGKFKYRSIDFFIINCIGLNVNYVIPFSKIKNISRGTELTFFPHRFRYNLKPSFLITDNFKERFDLIN